MKHGGSRKAGKAKGRTPSLSIPADPEVRRALDWLADQDGLTRAEWVRRAILREYTRRNKAPKRGTP